MSSCIPVLDKPHPRHHVVQLYSDEATLVRNVGRFLAAGLLATDLQLVIAAPEHTSAFCGELEILGIDSRSAVAERRLVLLDAAETLSKFMVGGQPQWDRFARTISGVLDDLCGNNSFQLRAYGEMVGILWRAGEYWAAIQLEEYWNRLLGMSGRFSLFCAYPIDIFDREFQVAGVDSLMRDHTHLLSSGDRLHLEWSINGALDQVLGVRAPEVKKAMRMSSHPSWGSVPEAETAILWIRENLDSQADEILNQARTRYHATRLDGLPPALAAS